MNLHISATVYTMYIIDISLDISLYDMLSNDESDTAPLMFMSANCPRGTTLCLHEWTGCIPAIPIIQGYI